MDSEETPAENVEVTATAPLSVLQEPDADSLEEATQSEIDERLTPERAMQFFEHATIEVESHSNSD